MTHPFERATISVMTKRPFAFARREDRRVFLGVAGGFADQHGVSVVVVRAAVLMLCFAGGLGVVLYALGHLLTETSGAVTAEPQPRDRRRDAAVGCIALGLAAVMRSTGLWLGDAVMATVVVVVGGVALHGVMRPDAHAQAWAGDPNSPLSAVVAGRHTRERIIAGGALIAVGLVLLAGSGGVSASLRIGVYATALTILGLAFLIGPWLARAAQSAAEERRQRIRLDEREAMAAHLHDSVLQTLALIQRSAADPRRTITLARRQETELRSWLYGRTDRSVSTLATALQAMVAEVEDLYDVRIDPVVVGDRPFDDTGAAFIGAIREACVNAAKHSGVDEIAVFLEIGAAAVDAFVRDRGVGFDLADVTTQNTGGRGIAQSIEARLERVGGRAVIDTAPGRGTEVHLILPFSDAESRAGA